jgi:transposase
MERGMSRRRLISYYARRASVLQARYNLEWEKTKKEATLMTIVCGIDAHDKELVCRTWRSDKLEETKRFRNTDSGRGLLWGHLRKMQSDTSATRVVVGYEACGLGYSIYAEASESGFSCHVLATTKMAKSPMDGKRKTDEYDAGKICEILRAHELAGLTLPTVWVPDLQLRDDRELVRRRFDVKSDATRVKNQIHGLLKRQGVKRPEGIKTLWTKEYMQWLQNLKLRSGALAHLKSLIYAYTSLKENVKSLDSSVDVLSETSRYQRQVEALTKISGVGTLTAMVFLTELGDLNRFPNRGSLKSYVGLAPTSHESGDIQDRKGHISRTGSSRLRAILNQAAWVRITWDTDEQAWFKHYVDSHAGGKRKGAVACMGRLVQVMWHRALEAQREYEMSA